MYAVCFPAGYPQFHLDGKNRLRPGVSQFRSRSDVFRWAVEVAQGRSEQFGLRHNCLGMQVDGRWEVFWVPLPVGLRMSSLLYLLKSYHLACFSGLVPKKIAFEHVLCLSPCSLMSPSNSPLCFLIFSP